MRHLKREREIRRNCLHPALDLQNWTDKVSMKKELHNSSCVISQDVNNICIHLHVEGLSLKEFNKERSSLLFFLSPPISLSVVVPGGNYNPAQEECGPVKQYKRIGALIPLD